MIDLQKKKQIVECMIGLQKIVPVMWEGYTASENHYSVYGFITYAYKRDFVVLNITLEGSDMNVTHVTSSIIHSDKIREYLHGSIEQNVEENPIMDLFRPVITNMITETNKQYGVDLRINNKDQHSQKGRQLIAFRLSDNFKLSLKEIGGILNIKYSSSCHGLVTKGIKNFKNNNHNGNVKKNSRATTY